MEAEDAVAEDGDDGGYGRGGNGRGTSLKITCGKVSV